MSLADTETGRERASGSAERHRRPGCGLRGSIPGARRRRERRSGWWPGYSACCSSRRAHRRRCTASTGLSWRFSATTLTAVFAIYALVLLATLLVFGSVSDYLGRRRVILAALR